MIKTEFMNLMEKLDQINEAFPNVEERLEVVNYVDYKHSYCHFLAPNLKKLNYICNIVQPPVSQIKEHIRAILSNPECRITPKEQLFLDEIYQHTDPAEIYRHIKNSIDKAYHIMVYVNSDGELVSNPTPEQVRDCMERDGSAVATMRADVEAKRKLKAEEKTRQAAIQKAEEAVAAGAVAEYNMKQRLEILRNDLCPAIDPKTQEIVFDYEQKKRIIDPVIQQAEADRLAKIAATKAANKERERQRAKQAKLDAPYTHWLTPSVVINGETMKSNDPVKVVGAENLKAAALEVANAELKWVRTEQKFYVATGSPFNWDGKVTVWCEYPDGREEVYRTFSLRKAESLEEAEQAAIRKSKEDAQLQAKCLAAAQKAIETGDIEIYNRGRWSRFILTKDFCPAVDPETLELVYDPIRKSEIWDQARRAYFKRQSEYRTNYAASRKAKTVGNIEEAVRVISDPDVLYHATEVGPFYDILNSGVMLHDVRNEGGVHAICFTTDDNYSIYGYPCKIKFSRSKLEQGGYELYPVDEFEDYGEGESEERIDEDINDVRRYVTEVIVDWEFIAVAQDGDDCRLSTGEYDDEGNESDNWDLKLSEFRALLDSLKASGIKVTEKGQPEADDDYWFDETGEFKYGREPAFV